LGNAYGAASQCEEAIIEYKKTLQLTPKNVFAFQGLSICYGFLEREEESRAAAAELLKLNPNFTINFYKKRSLYANKELVERSCNILRQAGIPEG
jgi:tetratricopeptide (TPR) repeat protein